MKKSLVPNAKQAHLHKCSLSYTHEKTLQIFFANSEICKLFGYKCISYAQKNQCVFQSMKQIGRQAENFKNSLCSVLSKLHKYSFIFANIHS